MDKRETKKADIYVSDPETGDEMLIGRHSKVNIIKNRFAKPYRESLDVPIYYEAYFPEIEEIAFDTGRHIKLISVYQGVFKWGDLKAEGRKNFIDIVKSKKLLDNLIESIKFLALEKEILLPPEITLYEPKIKDKKNGTNK